MSVPIELKQTVVAEELTLEDIRKQLLQLTNNLKDAIGEYKDWYNPSEVGTILGIMQNLNIKGQWSRSFTAGIKYATEKIQAEELKIR